MNISLMDGKKIAALSGRTETKPNYAAPSEEQNYTNMHEQSAQTTSTMSKENVDKSSLTQEFIEEQISASAYPDKVWKSIRGSYEGLDRPAAPMLAFGQNNYFETVISDENIDRLMDNLNKRGLKTVKNTDDTAKNADVFVIDAENKYLSAPFLSPKDAFKANIIMLEEIYNTGLYAARSNPLTRENLVKASNIDLSPSKSMDRTGKKVLDLKTVATENNQKHYEKTLENFVDNYISSDCYNNFNTLMKEVQKKDPSLVLLISEDAKKQAAPYIAQGNNVFKEHRDSLSKEIMQMHQEKLKPHIEAMYQALMINEAFNQGEAIKSYDAENIEFLQQNGVLKSVFHSGQNGGCPYSILAQDARMCFTYAASVLGAEDIEVNGTTYQPWGCARYAFGDSSHNGKAYCSSEYHRYRYGFCYEFESNGNKQEFIWNEGTVGELEIADFKGGNFDISRLNNDKDETVIFPHQNKLKAVYIAIEDLQSSSLERRLFKLELDENGKIKDEKWRNFVELHNPIDDNLKGNMIDRRNNMIADYDINGKEKMMDRHLNLSISEENVSSQTNFVAQQIQVEPQSVSSQSFSTLPQQNADIAQKSAPQADVSSALSAQPQEKVADMSKKEKGHFFHKLRMGINIILAKAEAHLSPEKTISQTKTQTNATQQPNIAQMQMVKNRGKII